MMTMMMAIIPTGIIVVEIGIKPRVIPHMTIVVAIVITRIIAPMIAMMHPRTTPRTPSIGIARHIVPVIPVTPCGEHIGIHAIVIYIPFPARPQSTAIHDIPVERTAHGNSVAGTAETDDAHGILVVRVATIETIHPTLIVHHTGEAQGIRIHP